MNLYLDLRQNQDELTRGELLMARSGDARDFHGAVALVATRLDISLTEAWDMVETQVIP